jgi:hypothetical protein
VIFEVLIKTDEVVLTNSYLVLPPQDLAMTWQLILSIKMEEDK